MRRSRPPPRRGSGRRRAVRVRPKRASAPDDVGRIEPPGTQHTGHEARGGGLAVRPRNRHPVPEPHDLAQHLRPRDDGNLAPARRLDLRVAGRDGGGHHHHFAGTHLLRAVPDVHPEPQAGETPGHLVLVHVRAAHLEAEVMENFRDPAHARAADADEVDPANALETVLTGGHAAFSRRPDITRGPSNFRQHAATRSAASRHPIRRAASAMARQAERSAAHSPSR